MTVVGGATYELDAKTEGFARGMNAMKAKLREVEKAADRAKDNISGSMKQMGTVMQGLMGVQLGGDPGKMAASWAKATGMLATDMQRVAAEGKAMGLNFAQATQRLMNLQQNMWAAKRGTGELYRALQKYDAEAAVMIRLTTTNAQRQELLNQVLARQKSAVGRAAIEMAAFGTAQGKAAANTTLVSTGMGVMGKALGGLVAISSLQRFLTFVSRTVKEVGDLAEAAQKAGVSIEDFQKLVFAGIGTGVDQSQMVSMMEMFNKRIGEAATKGGDLKKLFDANNISLRDGNGIIRDNITLLATVADLVRNARTEQEATVIATQALGRGGAELLPFLKQGGVEIRRIMENAEAAGGVIDSALVRAADEFADRWATKIAGWKKVFTGAIAEIAVGLDTLFTSANERTLDQLQVRADQIKRNIDLLKRDTFSGLLSHVKGGLDDQIKELEQIELRIRQLGGTKSQENVDLVTADLDAAIDELGVRKAEIETLLKSGSGLGMNNMLAVELAQINEQIAALRTRAQLLGTAGPAAGLSAPFAPGPPKPTVVPETEEKPARVRAHSDAIQQLTASMREELIALQAEADALGLSAEARAKVLAVAKLQAAARQEGRAPTQQEIADVQRLAAEEYNLIRVKELRTERERALREQIEESSRAQKEANEFLKSSVQDLTFSILDGTESIADSFERMAKRMLDAMLEAVIFGNGPFAGLFGKGGGLWGSLFGDKSFYGGGTIQGGGGIYGPALERMRGFAPSIPRAANLNETRGGSGRGGPSMNVQVIDQRGSGAAPIQTQRSGNSLKIFVRDAVNSALPGALDQIMPARFGVSPKTRPR